MIKLLLPLLNFLVSEGTTALPNLFHESTENLETIAAHCRIHPSAPSVEAWYIKSTYKRTVTNEDFTYTRDLCFQDVLFEIEFSIANTDMIVEVDTEILIGIAFC